MMKTWKATLSINGVGKRGVAGTKMCLKVEEIVAPLRSVKRIQTLRNLGWTKNYLSRQRHRALLPAKCK
jgi:hypothetical protein